MKDRKKVLLVDFNNLLYRSIYSHEGLSHKGTFTGGLFGAMDMISSTVNRYAVDRILICDDTKPYFRKRFYDKYKADRKKEEDEDRIARAAISRKLIFRFFSEFRFSLAKAEGWEADDFIGGFCREAAYRYSNIFIMSNDSDFYQLLTGRIFLCKTGGLYGKANYEKDFPGITPRDWTRCIALKGSHNGVPGIKGVGDKTAYKAVLNKMTDKEVFQKWRVRRSDIKARTDLATLPFPLVSDPPLGTVRSINYNAARFQEFCDEFGIKFRDEYHKAFMKLAT